MAVLSARPLQIFQTTSPILKSLKTSTGSTENKSYPLKTSLPKRSLPACEGSPEKKGNFRIILYNHLVQFTPARVWALPPLRGQQCESTSSPFFAFFASCPALNVFPFAAIFRGYVSIFPAPFPFGALIRDASGDYRTRRQRRKWGKTLRTPHLFIYSQLHNRYSGLGGEFSREFCLMVHDDRHGCTSCVCVCVFALAPSVCKKVVSFHAVCCFFPSVWFAPLATFIGRSSRGFI